MDKKEVIARKFIDSSGKMLMAKLSKELELADDVCGTMITKEHELLRALMYLNYKINRLQEKKLEIK